MKFHFSKLINFYRQSFLTNTLKNSAMLGLTCISDVAVFVIAGLLLSNVQNTKATAICIIIMFITVALSFFCHRLFDVQLSSITDNAILRKKSEKKFCSDINILRDLIKIISNRKSSIQSYIISMINLLIAVIITIIISPLCGLISVSLVIFCFFISEKKSDTIIAVVEKLYNAEHSSEENDDEIIFRNNELTETEAEIKSLLKISGIVAWTVSCFIPIILGQNLNQCITPAIMQLYILWQTYRLSETFSDINIVTFSVTKIDNLE